MLQKEMLWLPANSVSGFIDFRFRTLFWNFSHGASSSLAFVSALETSSARCHKLSFRTFLFLIPSNSEWIKTVVATNLSTACSPFTRNHSWAWRVGPWEHIPGCQWRASRLFCIFSGWGVWMPVPVGMWLLENDRYLTFLFCPWPCGQS